MADYKKKKNLKRLECLKKKIKELSILCDVDVLLLCKEDDSSSNSFYSWPEDRNSCLSLIEKYGISSVPTKSYKKKTNSVPLSPVLGKRKERSDSQMEFCECFQENKKSRMVFADGVDFDDFYGKFCESVKETQTVLSENVQENEKLELNFFDGIEFDKNYMRFCKLIQRNPDLDKRVPASEKPEADLDRLDLDDFYVKLSETVEEETDLYQNVQKGERFQEGFFDGLDSDEICSNFYQSIQENGDLSYTQMLLCENFQETEGFQMGFPDGVDFDEFYDSFCESIVENTNVDNKLKESKKSEMISLKDVDGIIKKLGHGDLKEILRWIDQSVTMLSKIKLL